MPLKKLKRLSVMGPREILSRIGGKLSQSIERIAYRTGRLEWSPQVRRKRLCAGMPSPPGADGLADFLHRHFRQRVEPPFLLDPLSLRESKELYFRLFAERLDALRTRADRVCAGRFGFLGIEFEAADPIAWQRDPKTGKDWPAKFHADLQIPFCDGIGDSRGAPDVKHVWELNRHEFLIECAKAYYLTGESRYAERVFSVISAWIRGNPPLQGVNWAGPLEVAVRALAWLWCYQFCRTWEGLSAEAHLELIESFYRHGSYLYRHVERYTSPNNHLVGEAAALYLLGGFFPEFDESFAWRERGWGILAAEPEKQFFADGGSTEQSTSYHHYCLGFFLLAMLTRQRQRQPVPETMRNRLEKALEYSLWMTAPDGSVPRIGDGDDSRSIRFEPAAHGDFRSFLGLGAVMFRRADFKAQAGSLGEDALWLLGAEGYRTYQSLPNISPAETSKVFPESGYALVRSGWGPEDHHLCFDCGPIGAGLYARDIPIFTHGHADMLSLTLCIFGKPLLVDGGFYAFGGAPDWHRYCREARGHNTLGVDGASQAKFNAANAWSCAASPGPMRLFEREREAAVEGSHSGFFGVRGTVRHRRTVSWDRNTHWSIRDELEGTGTHFIEVFFHFAPGRAELLAGEAGLRITTDAGACASLRCTGDAFLQAEIKRGEAEPDGGWVATSYGRRSPAPVVRFYGRVQLPASFTFALIAQRNLPARHSLESDGKIGETAQAKYIISELSTVK
ncbi:MAG: alginate lyase family protein [Pirellulales bacterium]|nr:alginate lyase family protein [Pirellulales bacterium]